MKCINKGSCTSMIILTSTKNLFLLGNRIEYIMPCLTDVGAVINVYYHLGQR